MPGMVCGYTTRIAHATSLDITEALEDRIRRTCGGLCSDYPGRAEDKEHMNFHDHFHVSNVAGKVRN